MVILPWAWKFITFNRISYSNQHFGNVFGLMIHSWNDTRIMVIGYSLWMWHGYAPSLLLISASIWCDLQFVCAPSFSADTEWEWKWTWTKWKKENHPENEKCHSIPGNLNKCFEKKEAMDACAWFYDDLHAHKSYFFTLFDFWFRFWKGTDNCRTFTLLTWVIRRWLNLILKRCRRDEKLSNAA